MPALSNNLRRYFIVNEGGTALKRPLLTVEYFLDLLLRTSHTLGGIDMVQYQIKQKLWSLGGKFKFLDNADNLAYYVQGSFMKIPKQFTITKPDGTQVSHIKKVLFQIFPKFDVTMEDGSVFRIAKKFALIRPRYEIEHFGLEVQGNFWDMAFELRHNGVPVAQISQRWLKINSTYDIDVFDDQYADAVISLVIAIDYVKAQQARSNASSSAS